MIITISLYRVSDGLPVSASTEFSQDKALIDCRRLMKGVAGRFVDFKSRCILHNRGYTMGWTSDNDLGLIGLIDSRTDNIELFAFLNFIADQFWAHYEPNKISSAQRPFAFIDFDAVIERNRRKFNKKIFEISPVLMQKTKDEIEARPAQVINSSQIKLELGKKQGAETLSSKFLHARSTTSSIVRLPPPSVFDCIIIVLALVAGALSFARGHQIATHQWKQWNLENHTSTEEFIHILTFKGTLILSIIQVWLMLFWFQFRKLANVINCILLLMCCAVEIDNRHWAVSSLFIFAHLLVTIKIHNRLTVDKRKAI